MSFNLSSIAASMGASMGAEIRRAAEQSVRNIATAAKVAQTPSFHPNAFDCDALLSFDAFVAKAEQIGGAMAALCDHTTDLVARGEATERKRYAASNRQTCHRAPPAALTRTDRHALRSRSARRALVLGGRRHQRGDAVRQLALLSVAG